MDNVCFKNIYDQGTTEKFKFSIFAKIIGYKWLLNILNVNIKKKKMVGN